MGLAASQARLLTITARKADCEFLSMNLSHQKIALSRNMERVSNEYQQALNTTKLVYDYYGSGDSDMALTYGLLMSPSIYNDYYPKLVTDSKNRVVLNSAYAAAARAAGIPAEGLLGTPSSDVRNKFIESLANVGIITAQQAVTIQGIEYNNGIGLGNGLSASQGLTEITFDTLLDLLTNRAPDLSQAGFKLGDSYIPDTDDNLKDDDASANERLIIQSSDGKEWQSYEKGDAFPGGTISLVQLLTSDTQYSIGGLTRKGEQMPNNVVDYLQEKLVGTPDDGSATNFAQWLLDSFSSVLGGTAASDTALQYAYNCLYDAIMPSDVIQETLSQHAIDDGKARKRANQTSSRKDGGKAHLAALNEACANVKCTGYKQKNYDTAYSKINDDYIGITATWNKEARDIDFTVADRKHKSQAEVNLNNLAKAFLTSYVQYMQGIETSKYNWQAGHVNECTLYNPETDDFMFTIVTDTIVDDEDTALYANFYDTMFNMICLNGWTENAQIDDKEYMSEMLKSGMVYISSISDDGRYYQGNYAVDRCILEVADEEAIAKAEAKYNTEKAKIENKEQTIDLKMKNLDTEISSLTTEYDTTKGIISKAIEKGFKRYDA